MNIEFHTTYKKVPEKLVTDTRDELLKLSHINKNISRAEVWMKADEAILSEENKICEIRITAYSEDMVARSRSGSFELAAKEALKELKRLVKQQAKKSKQPSEQVTSTVKV